MLQGLGEKHLVKTANKVVFYRKMLYEKVVCLQKINVINKVTEELPMMVLSAKENNTLIDFILKSFIINVRIFTDIVQKNK